jgi:hypothetical protein
MNSLPKGTQLGPRVQLPKGPKGKRNKFGARKVRTQQGTFDSQAEYSHYIKLGARQKTGQITDLQRQVRFDLRAKNGTLVGFVKVDFTYVEDGENVACEVKGYYKNDRAYALRAKLFKDNYPNWKRIEVT